MHKTTAVVLENPVTPNNVLYYQSCSQQWCSQLYTAGCVCVCNHYLSVRYLQHIRTDPDVLFWRVHHGPRTNRLYYAGNPVSVTHSVQFLTAIAIFNDTAIV